VAITAIRGFKLQSVRSLPYDLQAHPPHSFHLWAKRCEDGYIDKTGRVAITLRFDRADDFSEGLAEIAKKLRPSRLAKESIE